MKLNIGNVAKRLRWSYMTPEQAKAKGVDLDKWKRLVQAREKLEKIFYGAGGKTSNFKKAILQGKGNKDHAVHGLEGFGSIYSYHLNPMHPNHPVNSLNRNTPLRQLLGDEIFFSENDVRTLGELGEPVSLAMVTAASGVIAAIASTLKKIGDIFGGKGKGSQDFDEKTNADAEKEIPDAGKGTDSPSDDKSGGASSGGGDDGSGGSTAVSKTSGGGGDGGSGSGGGDGSSGGGSPAAKEADGSGDGGGDNDDPDGKSGFWDKNKKWIVPAGIGVAGLSIIAIAAKAIKSPKPPAKTSKPMHGTPHHKKQHHKNHHRKNTQGKHKIKAKALL
jgi:hypothetical protein